MRSKTDYLRVLRTPEGCPARRLARDRHPALHAGAELRRQDDRRVRHLVRHLDPASRRGSSGQRRRSPDHQRVRALQGRARAGQSHGRRSHRPRGDPRGRRSADADRRPSRHDRPAPARRRQGALPRSPEPRREPPQTGRAHRRRRRPLQPRLHGARALALEGLHVRAVRRGRRAVDEDSADVDDARPRDACLRHHRTSRSALESACGRRP